MSPRALLFWMKIGISSVAAIVAGIFYMEAVEGMALFILALFLSSAILVTFRRSILERLTVGRVYREGIGTSLLTFLLIWALTFNLLGKAPVIYLLASRELGPQPISFVNGTLVPPGVQALGGRFNAVNIEESPEVGPVELFVGFYAKRGGVVEIELTTGRIVYDSRKDTFVIVNSSVVEAGQNATLPWGLSCVQPPGHVFIEFDLHRVELEQGSWSQLDLSHGGVLYTISATYSTAMGSVNITLMSSPLEPGDLTPTPFQNSSSLVLLQNDFLFAFEPGTHFMLRTLRVGDSYLVFP